MADRQTRVLGGNLARTQSFELAPGILQYVQSVLVEVDASASPATTPLLTVKTQDGVPIADVEQGRSLTAGGAGRATWALGLDEEVEPATEAETVGALIRRDAGGVAQNVPNSALLGIGPTGIRHNILSWQNLVTVSLAANPSTLTIQVAGLYLVQTKITWLPGNFPNAGVTTAFNGATTAPAQDIESARIVANQFSFLGSSELVKCVVGDVITQVVSQNTGGPIAAPQASLTVVRLGPLP